jgi:hypothetical protein
MAFLLYSDGALFLYSKDVINNKKQEELMNDIMQNQNFITKQNNFQWDHTTKQTILDYDIFLINSSRVTTVAEKSPSSISNAF